MLNPTYSVSAQDSHSKAIAGKESLACGLKGFSPRLLGMESSGSCMWLKRRWRPIFGGHWLRSKSSDCSFPLWLDMRLADVIKRFAKCCSMQPSSASLCPPSAVWPMARTCGSSAGSRLAGCRSSLLGTAETLPPKPLDKECSGHLLARFGSLVSSQMNRPRQGRGRNFLRHIST